MNKQFQPKLTKKSSQKSPTSEKLKKIRGSKLCSQGSKVNEELNQNKLEEVPEIVENLAIPAGPVGSQSLQNMARELRNLQGVSPIRTGQQ